MTDLERFQGNSDSRQTLFEIVTEFRRADQIARDVLVRHIRRLLASLGKRAKFAAPEPHEPYQIQLLVVIERGQRRFEFLQRGVAASLQDIHLLIIGGNSILNSGSEAATFSSANSRALTIMKNAFSAEMVRLSDVSLSCCSIDWHSAPLAN